jgi:hypothetical protein
VTKYNGYEKDMKKITLIYRDFEGNIAKESVWAEESDRYYQIKNSPFFAANLAWGDIIEVYEEDKMLYYSKLIQHSGNSTIQIVCFENMQDKLKEIINKIHEKGCGWESMHNGSYYSLNIPVNINYSEIRNILQKGLKENILDFREACLSDVHRSQVL